MNDTFPVPTDAYLAFDGLTIKDKIRQRLTQTGIFSDQNYEGSNLSALNDVIAMVFSLLIYNLNKTSSNGNFSEANLYKSINGIVKGLNYNPIGHQTASVNFTLSAQNLTSNFYTIPRYSYLSIGGINYSLNQDLTFSKLVDNSLEEILNVDNSKIIYQGSFKEYPTVISSGTPNETVFLVTDSSLIIDNFNIFVYVKEPNGAWKQWTKTSSLYLNNAADEVFEIRFNPNKIYEIKFGNNINGKQLPVNSQIAVYYLVSDGENGEVGIDALYSKKLNLLDTSRLTEILSDDQTVNLLTSYNISNSLLFSNKSPSTYYAEPETVEQIKANAPANYKSQFSLTTNNSYETFLKTNFSNIIHDVKVMSNETYLDSYIKYFYNLGLTRPELEYRALYNQINYADSCNFNNIYCFCVPKTRNNIQSYMYPSQKSLILNTIKEEKVLTSEVLIVDPVYMAVDFAASSIGEPSVSDIDNTDLIVYKTSTTRKSDATLKSDVNNLIVNFFNRVNNSLGQTLNINQLLTDILALEGVSKIATRIKDTNTIVEGLQLIIWNPLYPTYTTSFTTNISLENFQFPFLYTSTLLSRISIM